jgi:hypothetical protein
MLTVKWEYVYRSTQHFALQLHCLCDFVLKVKLPKYVKIGVLDGRNARYCHVDLHEALGGRAVLYRTIATSVQEFKSGRGSTSALHRTGPYVSVHTDMSVVAIEQSTDEDRHWSVKEIAAETTVCGSRVLRTLT